MKAIGFPRWLISISIFFSIFLTYSQRDPFQFVQESIKQKTLTQSPNLEKWNIKDIQGDNIIIQDNNGQIRTITINS